jgi:hypothetical protein
MLLNFSSARHSPASFLLLIFLTKREAQNRNLPAVISELKPKIMGRQWNWKATLTLQPKREFWLQERINLKEWNRRNGKNHIVYDIYFGKSHFLQNTNFLWLQFAMNSAFLYSSHVIGYKCSLLQTFKSNENWQILLSTVMVR